MRDSPAAGKYNPKHEYTKTESPKFTVSKTERFKDHRLTSEIKATLPVSYQKSIYDKKDYSRNSIGIGDKFYLYDYKKRHDLSPGPVYETAKHKSIEHSMHLHRDKTSRYGTIPVRDN
jgi:hypothetical protein